MSHIYNCCSGGGGGGGSDIPSGTVMLFFQANAPAGWTKIVTVTEATIRIVSGVGGGSGGADSFSSVFGAGRATANHALTEAEMPVHTHTQRGRNANVRSGGGSQPGWNPPPANDIDTGETLSKGGGAAHAHDLTMDLKFIDCILCSKD